MNTDIIGMVNALTTEGWEVTVTFGKNGSCWFKLSRWLFPVSQNWHVEREGDNLVAVANQAQGDYASKIQEAKEWNRYYGVDYPEGSE